jgi:hypothetical protein
MNKICLLFAAACFISCGSSKVVSPLLDGKQSAVLLDTNDLKTEPEKSKKEDKTVVLLNQLFNSDATNKKTVLLISNESDCDFIMNILGGKSYTVPVAARKTESIVVDQGEYVMKSEVCKSPYLAHKTLQENTQVNIKYTMVTNLDNNPTGNATKDIINE